jgi:hypothetical protein
MSVNHKTEQQKTDLAFSKYFDDNFEKASDLLQQMLVKGIMRKGRNPELFKQIAVNEWERIEKGEAL